MFKQIAQVELTGVWTDKRETTKGGWEELFCLIPVYSSRPVWWLQEAGSHDLRSIQKLDVCFGRASFLGEEKTKTKTLHDCGNSDSLSPPIFS